MKVIITIISAMLFLSCSKSTDHFFIERQQDEIIGVWESEKGLIEFNRDYHVYEIHREHGITKSIISRGESIGTYTVDIYFTFLSDKGNHNIDILNDQEIIIDGVIYERVPNYTWYDDKLTVKQSSP